MELCSEFFNVNVAQLQPSYSKRANFSGNVHAIILYIACGKLPCHTLKVAACEVWEQTLTKQVRGNDRQNLQNHADSSSNRKMLCLCQEHQDTHEWDSIGGTRHQVTLHIYRKCGLGKETPACQILKEASKLEMQLVQKGNIRHLVLKT